MAYDKLDTTHYPRYYNLRRLFETFPERTFVLVGDTTPSSMLSAYVRIAKEFPNQVQCLIVRDVSATEPANFLTANLKAMHRLKGKNVLFRVPSDLDGMADVLARLHRGELVGCGDANITTDSHAYGALTAWIVTGWRAFHAVSRCSLLLWDRPHIACPFDRREGTWYRHRGYEPQHDGQNSRITRVEKLPGKPMEMRGGRSW